jgi:hypothetical protein
MSNGSNLVPRQNSSTGMVIGTILLGLFVLFFVLFVYAFVHESGHALVGLLFGQQLSEFKINLLEWDAHVSMNGSLTAAQEALQSVAGAGLPLLLWFVLIRLVPRKASFSIELLKLLGSMVVLNTLLPWIILPFLYMLGKAPPDDVTNFLHYSQMPPVLLAFTAAVFYARGWAVFPLKIDGLRNEFLLFQISNHNTLVRGGRAVISAMGAILAACLLITFTLNRSAVRAPLSAPDDFTPAAQIDLSAQAFSDVTVSEFTLTERSYAGVFVVIRGINTTYFDLSVTGPDGYHSTIIHGEGYNAFEDGGLWEQNLPPGTYRVVLNTHQSPGTVSVHVKIYES